MSRNPAQERPPTLLPQASRRTEDSDARFRRAIEAAHAMVYEINVTTGEIIDIHGFGAVLGYETVEKPLSLKGWFGYIHPEDRAELAESDRAARAAPGEGYTRQFRLRHQAGHHIWVEDTGRIYPGENGQAARAIGTLVDITRRKEAEDARRESEERFRVAQELSLDAFTILDAVRDRDGEIVDFRWRYVNPVAARVLKHPREELEGKFLLDVLPGNKTDSDLFVLYVKVVETGIPHDVEIPYEADGISGWYRNMAVKLGDGIAIYFTDITARKKTEQALRASEERFAKAFWASPDALSISRVADGRILEVNENWEKLTGHDRIESIGRTDTELELYFRHGDRLRLLAELQQRGSLRNYELTLRRCDGAPCEVSMSVETTTLEGVPAYITIFRDISARKVAELDQRFLLALGDVMLQPSGEDELIVRITEAVALHLHASGCVFGEVDRVAHAVRLRWVPDADPGGEQVKVSLGSIEPAVLVELEAGRAVVCNSFPTLMRLAPSATPAADSRCLGVPLLQNGVWIAGLWVYAEGVRTWSDRDVGLLQAVIDRTQLALDAVRAEAALRRSEARFRATFEQAPVGVIQLDAGGRVTMANPAYCAMLGFTAGELVGRSPSEWTQPEDVPTAQLLRKNLMSGRTDNYTYEKRYIRKDGAMIWVQVNAALIADGAQRPNAAVNIVQDITMRRQSEEQIAYQAFLLRNVRDAIIAVDAEEHITVWNSGAEELYGWKAEEALGRRVTEIVRTSSSPDHLEASRRALARGMPTSVETVHLHRDGTAIHVELVSTALHDAAGNIMGFVGISRDITERKRFEMALQALNETLEERVAARTTELQRSNRELDQFAYVASHDLKAPLRAIATLASWIADDAAALLPEASQRHLAKLQGRIARMDALLDDLLSYSRAGRVRHPLEWVDSVRLINDVVDLLAPPPGLATHVEAGMPLFLAERVPLETVFRNLIGNAIKHHHDPAHANITISAQQVGAWIEFCVADDGPGIDPAFHERIFAMFQTLRPRDQVEGSGIGLTLVKKLVETRGGQVTLVSSPRCGATFRFTWPVVAEE